MYVGIDDWGNCVCAKVTCDVAELGLVRRRDEIPHVEYIYVLDDLVFFEGQIHPLKT